MLACAYAAFSGWGIPAQRTCAMLLLFGAVRWLGLRWPWPMVWALAAAAVVALDPWGLLQAGFWLSFWAVAVLFASDGAQAAARSVDAPLWHRALRAIRAQAHAQQKRTCEWATSGGERGSRGKGGGDIPYSRA